MKFSVSNKITFLVFFTMNTQGALINCVYCDLYFYLSVFYYHYFQQCNEETRARIFELNTDILWVALTGLSAETAARRSGTSGGPATLHREGSLQERD